MHITLPARAVLLASIAAGAACLIGGNDATAQAPAASAQAYKETIAGTLLTFELVPVPGGSVVVGGTTIPVAPFLIGRTEVTWDLYDLYAQAPNPGKTDGSVDAIARPSRPYGSPDYGWGRAGYPAISVARQAAETFCRWLSARTGKNYRLPTEAEWVRAAELAAGQLPAASREAIAWHAGNATGTTHPVATRKADRLGLFDLFGNAAEWVMPADGALVTRGGSFRDPLDETGPQGRARQDSSWNERDPQLPKSRWWLSDGPFVGFRVVSDAK